MGLSAPKNARNCSRALKRSGTAHKDSSSVPHFAIYKDYLGDTAASTIRRVSSEQGQLI